jgi:hypothetical protein
MTERYFTGPFTRQCIAFGPRSVQQSHDNENFAVLYLGLAINTCSDRTARDECSVGLPTVPDWPRQSRKWAPYTESQMGHTREAKCPGTWEESHRPIFRCHPATSCRRPRRPPPPAAFCSSERQELIVTQTVYGAEWLLTGESRITSQAECNWILYWVQQISLNGLISEVTGGNIIGKKPTFLCFHKFLHVFKKFLEYKYII